MNIKLPPDIHEHILEYYNPYRMFFRKHVLKDIWKTAWRRYYKNIQDQDYRSVVYYILSCWKIFVDPNAVIQLRHTEHESNLRKKYFPSDIQFSIHVCSCKHSDATIFIRRSEYEPSEILFHGYVFNHNVNNYRGVNPVASSDFTFVYYDTVNKRALYRYAYDQTWSSRISMNDLTSTENAGVHSYPYPY